MTETKTNTHTDQGHTDHVKTDRQKRTGRTRDRSRDVDTDGKKQMQ